MKRGVLEQGTVDEVRRMGEVWTVFISAEEWWAKEWIQREVGHDLPGGAHSVRCCFFRLASLRRKMVRGEGFEPPTNSV